MEAGSSKFVTPPASSYHPLYVIPPSLFCHLVKLSLILIRYYVV